MPKKIYLASKKNHNFAAFLLAMYLYDYGVGSAEALLPAIDGDTVLQWLETDTAPTESNKNNDRDVSEKLSYLPLKINIWKKVNY